jgi:hypothetical protein
LARTFSLWRPVISTRARWAIIRQVTAPPVSAAAAATASTSGRVVTGQVACSGCLTARGHQQPGTPLRRHGADGGCIIGHQLGDDLPGCHQPAELVLGVGELLAQQPGLTGQLGHLAGDPFRQLQSAPQGYYCANRDGCRR